MSVYVPNLSDGGFSPGFTAGQGEYWSIGSECVNPPAGPMFHKRFYPSIITMQDGNMLALDGACDDDGMGYPWAPSRLTAFGPGIDPANPTTWQWTGLWGARYHGICGSPYTWNLGTYPWVFVVPPLAPPNSGTIFVAGTEQGLAPSEGPNSTWRLNLQLERWTEYPSVQSPMPKATACMYRQDRIFRAGDAFYPCPKPEIPPYPPPAAHRAQILELTANGEWIDLPPMPTTLTDEPWREHMNLTAVPLPDGKVLCVGGPVGARPDLFNPYDTTQSPQGSWSQIAPLPISREYHASALCLLDGSVWCAGGEGLDCPDPGYYDPNRDTYCIWYPPYVFTIGRPQITSAPPMTQVIPWGGLFTVNYTSGGAAITKVRLIRTGAATHGFDQNTRLVELDFGENVPGTGTLSVIAPPDGYTAPPGIYMLFVCTDENGKLPSKGKFVRIGM